MAQLLFEPVATKIGNDDWLVVPKNNIDIIDVGENGTSDVREDSAKCCMRCSTIIKDIVLAMWGTPIEVNGVLKGHIHSEEIAENIAEQYADVWEADENGKYSIELGEETIEKDTLAEAVEHLVIWTKNTLQALNSENTEDGGESDDDDSGGA